jgi:hypothetical protein
MTNPYPTNNPLSSLPDNTDTANEKEILIGKTDTMNLPETHHFIDIDSSTPIFSWNNIYVTTEGFFGLGLATLTVLAGGLCLLKYGYKNRDYLFTKSRLKIAENTILFYDLALNNLENFAELAQQSDQEIFNQPDFLSFAKLKYSLITNQQEYKELVKPIQRLESALKARFYYQQIENLELNCQSSTLNSFYRLVSYLLAECLDKDTFELLIEQQLLESFNSPITEIERQTLLDYFQAIKNIIEDDCGLTILRLFKQFQSEHFSLLTMVSDIIDKTGNLSMDKHPETCQKLAEVIALSQRLITAKTFQIFGEYISLERRYSSDFVKFNELINILHNWYISYQVAVGIRQEYPVSEYRQPQSFKREISGLNLYQKYQQFINDKINDSLSFELDEFIESAFDAFKPSTAG